MPPYSPAPQIIMHRTSYLMIFMFVMLEMDPDDVAKPEILNQPGEMFIVSSHILFSHYI